MIGRVDSRRLFAELRTQGERVRSGPVRLTFCARDESFPRLAFAFNRKFGTAVERNRARRRLRAAFVEVWEPELDPAGSYLLTGSRRLLTAEFAVVLDAVADCLALLSGSARPAAGQEATR